MKNPFPRLCLPQPSYPRRKVPLMPAPESSSHTLAGAFPPAPVATISPLSLTFCFCLLILCSNIKGGIVMKNFALTLALLSAAVLSPAATPSPAHAADTLPAPAALSPAHAAGTLPIASAPDAPAVPPAAFSAGSSAAQNPRGMTAPAPEQNLLDGKIKPALY